MNREFDKPWMSYSDVVDDLVQPSLRLVGKELGELGEQLRSLQAAQQYSADQLTGLRKEHWQTIEQVTGLRKEHWEAAAKSADLARQLHLHHLGSTVESQTQLTRELREALGALHRDQTQARDRAAALERRITELQTHRPLWIVGAVMVVLVVADLATRFL
jgi:septation ring formation regulator EzrA